MSEPDLSAELRRRAEEAAAETMREAKAEAARIVAEADARIESQQRDALEREEAAFREGARERVAVARHEAMHASLLAKTRLVERVLSEVESRLPEVLEGEAYRKLLAEEVAEALTFVGDEQAVVRCTPKLVPAVRAALGGRAHVKVEPTAAVGSGFVAADAAGAVRVDATLAARLERLTPTLAIEILRRLSTQPP